MKAIANYLSRALLGVVCITFAAMLGTGAGAQEVTAETLVDRLQIQDCPR